MTERNKENLFVQKIYPVINNEDLLEFRIPPFEKGQIDLENVLIHFTTKIQTHTDKTIKVRPQNFYGAKQFSSVEVKLNGEAITRRSCANEFFLGAYFHNICNYSADYLTSAMRPTGIFDCYNTTTEILATKTTAQVTAFTESRKFVTDSSNVEILMGIDSSIFRSGDILPSNTPLEISFERATSDFSSIITKDGTLKKAVNELKDVYLTVPFVHDIDTFHNERNAISKPLKVRYDDYAIRRFNIPKGSNNVRLDNILTGVLPSKIFWGIQTIESYSGSFKQSSTRFGRHKLSKASLYLDGNEYSEFPITMTDDNVAQPYVKFLQNTNKQQNGYLGKLLEMSEFATDNFILSATLNSNTNGTVSFEFEFEEPINNDLVLIVCSLKEKILKIDNNRNFQIL